VQPDALSFAPVTGDPTTDGLPVERRGASDDAPTRDAGRIAERIARDEAQADDARDKFRAQGLPEL
jgi:hypothetical protein